MKRDSSDIPETLAYFVTDTGDAVHSYSGPLRDSHEETIARQHYPHTKSVERMWIGHYKLVEVEEIPVPEKKERPVEDLTAHRYRRKT